MMRHRSLSVAVVGVVGVVAIAVQLGLPRSLWSQGADPIVAYEVPAGLEGNQDYGGALGLDFDVQLDILVTRIGVFDSGSDGLNLPITAWLYDRDDPALLPVAGPVEFTAEDPGELVGGSRFKELEIELPAGFRGTVAASGYGLDELNGNLHGDISNPLGLSLNDGGCAIQFTGSGRFGVDPVSFPDTADGGPPNRYAAGTFEFVPQESFNFKADGIAYFVPAGTIGNQFANVGLGMDFNVNVPIVLTRLGVFDSSQDGLMAPLVARVFNRDNQEEMVHLDFAPEDPGELLDGSRFKDLVPPLELPAGFHGTIVGEGYNDLEPNGNQGDGPLPGMELNNGGCALSFVGGGRLADVLGTFPTRGDGGPANRYAAGTFKFEIDDTPPPPPPGIPRNLKLTAGDGKIDITWEAPAGDPPAAMYRIFSAPSLTDPFTQLAEVAATSFSHLGLPNDVGVCYYLRAVSAGGVESYNSLRKCATPTPPLLPGHFIAYKVPSGTAGNQNYGGALGHDFDVTADISIVRLGVFDDGSDGLNLPLAARIFDRDSITEMALVEFTPDDPGVLIDGSRFKELDEPLELSEGFHGTVAASGYGDAERNGNQGVGALAGLTTDDGGCRISFVGVGRFGDDPAGFPGTPDGGPPNRYAAGTFEYEALGPTIDPTPQPPTGLTASVSQAKVLLAWIAPPAQACVVQPTSYKVFRSINGGAAAQIAEVNATSYTDEGAAAGAETCYVVRSVGLDAGGATVESTDSLPACVVLGKHLAYVVPSGTAGARIDGVPLGMDFDVELDIRITRLGAFDSAGDGLIVPITVRIYNRDTETELTSLQFTPDDAGTLLNGSRFKALPAALDIAGGTRCAIVAEGYGVDEPAGENGPWTTDPGPCSLFFVGKSRSVIGGAILPLPNLDGRVDQYAAGTFEFEPRSFGTPRSAIAYNVPAGTIGNQVFPGNLGMDFNVNVDITVTRIGVFDSGSDGLSANLRARLYNRDTQEALVEMLFNAANPGDLEEGSRFKPIDPPLTLPAGFRGVIAAAGYNAREMNGNFGPPGGDILGLTADDGGCAITFVGGGRFGQLGAIFPNNFDGGPANRYAAGTFEFEVEGGPPVVVFQRGDADQNKILQLTDAVQILSYLFLGVPTKVPDCFDAADADDNGIVQLTDAVRVLAFLFTGGPPPSPPFDVAGPTCGADLTVDEIECAGFVGCP